MNTTTAALASYLEQHIAGFSGPLSLKKFPGGQSNPTFLLTSTSGQYVLRSKPPGELLASAHAVDREYRVLRALENTEVPVAKASVWATMARRRVTTSARYPGGVNNTGLRRLSLLPVWKP